MEKVKEGFNHKTKIVTAVNKEKILELLFDALGE